MVRWYILPAKIRTQALAIKLKAVLNAQGYNFTDFGGIFFTETNFGNVDIFFERP